MFTQPNSKPTDRRRDQYEWKALLAEAGVREARLHDARHTLPRSGCFLAFANAPSWM